MDEEFKDNDKEFMYSFGFIVTQRSNQDAWGSSDLKLHTARKLKNNFS